MTPLILTAVVVSAGLAVSFFFAMTNYDRAEYNPFAKAIGRKVTIDTYRDYILVDSSSTRISGVERDEYIPDAYRITFKNGFALVISEGKYHAEPFTFYSSTPICDDDSVIDYRIKFL